MTQWTDADLYLRGNRTLVASWQAYALSGRGAAVTWFPGVAAAVFPHDPECEILNNALLDRDLDAGERADAVDSMEAAYAATGIAGFAAWVHESDQNTHTYLRARGYVASESTRVMGMDLDGLTVPKPAIELASAEWPEVLRIAGLPAGFGGPAAPAGFTPLVVVSDGTPVATVATFDHSQDCGIYNLATLPHARRKGLGTALATLATHDARARGCRTATVQATPMAERIYTAIGFRDLGRVLEYTPGPSINITGRAGAR